MSAVFVLYFCIWLLEVKAQGRDTTRIPGSSGTTVVQATVALIQESGIFPDDHQLLRRIAWVESKDGTDSQTYRQGYHGGIWQVDLIGFRDTQDTTSHPGLVSKFREIQGRFNIDWRSVQWEDLRKPLYSGLAARLFLSNVAESIPLASDVAGQASYWKRHYNTESGAGTEARFVEDVMGLEEGKITWGCATSQMLMNHMYVASLLVGILNRLRVHLHTSHFMRLLYYSGSYKSIVHRSVVQMHLKLSRRPC